MLTEDMRSYESVGEYFEDILYLVRRKIDLYTRFAVRMSPDGNIRKIYGSTVFREELENIMEEEFTYSDASRYEDEMLCLNEELELVSNRAKASAEEGVFIPTEYIFELFHLSDFERHCMLMSLAVELDRGFERIYSFLQDDFNIKYPTLDLCIKTYTLFPELQKELVIETAERREFLYYLFVPKADTLDSELSWQMKIDKRVSSYLLEYNAFDIAVKEISTYFTPQEDDVPDLMIHEDTADYLMQILSNKIPEQKLLFYLHGEYGSGKRLQVLTAGSRLNFRIIMVDLRLIIKNEEIFEAHLKKIIREVLLMHAHVCFTHFEVLLENKEEREDTFKINKLLHMAYLMSNVVFLTSEKPWDPREMAEGLEFVELYMRKPTVGERIKVWTELLKERDVTYDFSIAALADKFLFTPGVIKKVIQESYMRSLTERKESIDGVILHEICQKFVNNGLNELALRINSDYNWEELIMPDDQKKILNQLFMRVKNYHKVYDDWGFGLRMPNTPGISAIFTGPSGCGKTMAAQVLKKQLQMELYKIHLSGLISTHTGETEKRLDEIFQKAGHSNSILLFDETDLLLKDHLTSRDLYLNSISSYFLQKVTEYEGIVILSTNLEGDILEAYRNKVDFLVRFKIPDVKERMKIWKNIFPRGLSGKKVLDFKEIAESYELTGRMIKNIAVNCAFIAVERGEEVTMEHIKNALQQELQRVSRDLVIESK